jgi:hypothetical protein
MLNTPKVAIIGGIPNFAIENPFINPIKAPERREKIIQIKIITATGKIPLNLSIVHAHTTEDKLAILPTEISIPPVKITIASPNTKKPIIELSPRIEARLNLLKKPSVETIIIIVKIK